MSFPHLTSKKSGINPLGQAQELTLKADTGFFADTGTAASPLRGYPLTASAGSYTLTGTAATLFAGERLVADTGAFTWNGTAATLTVGYYLSSQAGSYTETGTDATLNYSSNPVAVSLSQTQIKRQNYPRAFAPAVFGKRKFNFVNEFTGPSDPGDFLITGTDAQFSTTTVGGSLNQRGKVKRAWPRPFAPSPWGHLTRQQSFNRLSSATITYALSADSGAWTWNGTDVGFNVNHVVAAVSGVWNWSVSAATLNKGGTLVTTPGSFVITAADLTFAVNMPVEAGQWDWTGGTIDLFYSNAPEAVKGMLLMGVG